MNGNSHCLVANFSMACLSPDERHILYPRWGGIEAGATLSDRFRIMWESIEPGSKDRQLVHRCFVDSKDPKDHGCITRALDHAEGSIAFINDYLSGQLDDAYSENEFLENLGMFLGVASHHIADLCTPVHVGHNIDFRSLGYSSLAHFHSRVERDISRFERRVSVKIPKPESIEFSDEYFWDIARDTFENTFVQLQALYSRDNEDALVDMVSKVISAAVRQTTNVWHTVLSSTKMTDRKWSMQPLL